MQTKVHDEERQATTSRGSFLKKVAGVVAVGLGIAAAPGTGRASTLAIHCCENYTQCRSRIVCSNQHYYYWCETLNCCACFPNQPPCIYTSEVPC